VTIALYVLLTAATGLAWTIARRLDPDREVQGANPPEAERTTFQRWISRITINVAAHHRERVHHRVEDLRPEPRDEAVPDPAPWPDAAIESEEARLDLLAHPAALARIAPDEAAVVIAHEIDGIPMAEIAEQQGIPLPTAYHWRARGIAALRATLTDEEE
jgi:RNA polymerase sigma factor (sigma-70 family)